MRGRGGQRDAAADGERPARTGANASEKSRCDGGRTASAARVAAQSCDVAWTSSAREEVMRVGVIAGEIDITEVAM